MNRMFFQSIREKATTWNLTAILKGPHQSVQSIYVPERKWFHSREKKQLYRFNNGVFGAHSNSYGDEYRNHYTHKVPYAYYSTYIHS